MLSFSKNSYNTHMNKTNLSPSILHVARKVTELLSGQVTPLKLQKLVYYCQAWSLVWRERPMFNEDFQAWANGPVNPELFSRHKGLYVLGDDFLSEFSGFRFNDEDTRTIDAVLGFYGDKEPFYLSELTHKERPWKDARGQIPLGEPSSNLIPKDSMQEYYMGISTSK